MVDDKFKCDIFRRGGYKEKNKFNFNNFSAGIKVFVLLQKIGKKDRICPCL